MLCAVVVLSAFTASAPSPMLPATAWKIDKGFEVKFMNPKAEGFFKELKGDIVFDADALAASKFSVTLPTESISTGNGMKNSHAKSGDWFDAKKYSSISFVSTEIAKSGADYVAKGNLTMHGVTKPITIAFSFKSNGKTGLFAGNFSVKYREYGIKGKGGSDDDTVKIELKVPVVQ